MLKKVMINIKTERSTAMGSLFDGEDELAALVEQITGISPDPEVSEMTVEGKLKENLGTVELKYNETELSGMEGSLTTLSFSENCSSLITLMRSGLVNTALVFEEGKRNICAYNTPFMPFEVCVHTIKVENRLLTAGTLFMDYVVEIRGADAERCKMKITVREVKKMSLPRE